MISEFALIESIDDVKNASAAKVSLTLPVSARETPPCSANRYNERQQWAGTGAVPSGI
jgi:hypothetical protein